MHSCFGAGSYSDQGNGFERPVIGVGEERGLLEYEGDWEAFYHKASADQSLHLVKSHLLPRDAQPAIVVVRDPRSSLCSYYYYLRKHWTHETFTLQQIISGDVFYGDWIDFYSKWLNREAGNTLLVYYHELVELNEATVSRLSAFTGLPAGDCRPVNFDQLRDNNPSFFRSGKMAWDGDPAWTDEVEGLFRERFTHEMKKFGFK